MGKCSCDSDGGDGFKMLWDDLVGELLDGKTLNEFVARRLERHDDCDLLGVIVRCAAIRTPDSAVRQMAARLISRERLNAGADDPKERLAVLRQEEKDIGCRPARPTRPTLAAASSPGQPDGARFGG